MMNEVIVNMGGKDRILVFGLGSIGEIIDYLDTDLPGLGTKVINNPFKTIPAIVFYAHSYHVRRKKQIVDFSLMDVSQWIEDLDNTYANKQIEEAILVLLDSMRKFVPGLAEAEEVATGPKKK